MLSPLSKSAAEACILAAQRTRAQSGPRWLALHISGVAFRYTCITPHRVACNAGFTLDPGLGPGLCGWAASQDRGRHLNGEYEGRQRSAVEGVDPLQAALRYSSYAVPTACMVTTVSIPAHRCPCMPSRYPQDISLQDASTAHVRHMCTSRRAQCRKATSESTAQSKT